MIRVDKWLSQAGAGTRTQVKAMIRSGRVTVNGAVIKKADQKADEEKDVICLDGRQIGPRGLVYYMLNKPMGTVTAVSDKRERTVMDLLDLDKRDLFPVGRLDKDTEGLLLITNDGELSHRLLSPAKHVPKIYEMLVSGRLDEGHVRQFLAGIDIGEKKPCKPAVLKILSDGAFALPDCVGEDLKDTDLQSSCTYASVQISEGKFHQIKRMFHAVGCEVLFLRRIQMGPLQLDQTLSPGMYRELKQSEIDLLQADPD